MPDLTALDAAGLVQKLADPNLIVRTLATNELVEARRIEDWAGTRLEIGLGWVFGRVGMGGFRDVIESLGIPADDHVQDIQWLVEGPSFPMRDGPPGSSRPFTRFDADATEQCLRELVTQPDPKVRRAAASALSRFCSPKNLAPLLTSWKSVGQDDTELFHAVRMALRDNLLTPGGYSEASKIVETDATASDKIADVSLGAKTPEAAEFLFGHLTRTKLQGARSGEFLRHAALYLPAEKLGAIAGLIENVKDAPLPQRLSVADNLAQAYRQRGIPLPDATTAWTQRTRAEAAPKP